MRTKRVPGLDGLRAISVLFVIAFHARLGFAKGGGLGVTVFFVLSGFLITTLLLASQDRSGLDLRRFYVRRLLRLYPALIALVVVTLLIKSLWLPGWPGTTGGAVASLLYVSNWTSALGPNGGLFLHTWSLSVEEQFYLAWPLVILVLAKPSATSSRRRLATITLVIAIISHVGGVGANYLSGNPELSRITPFTGGGLLFGCSLALFLNSATDVDRDRLAVLSARAAVPSALVLLLSLIAAPSGTAADLVVGPLVFITATVLVAHCATTTGPVVWLLQIPPLRLLGLVSYGMYLYHFVILAAVEHALPDGRRVVIFAVTAAATTCVAIVSYWVVEQPFLRIKDRLAPEMARSVPARR